MPFYSHKHSIVLAAGLFGFAVSAGAEIKCWTNDQGVRECGNSVPPEYAQQSHKRINEQGIVIDEKERAPSDEELAEQKRQAAIEAEKARERAKQREQDSILLETFSSEDDIISARDDKVAAMNAQIKLAESRLKKLRASLNKRMEKAAAEERAGNTPAETLLQDIESLRRQIQANEDFIADTEADREQIKSEYNADLERFRQLKQDG